MPQLQAKSVLERDLASLRAKRAERESALRAEKLRAAGKTNVEEASSAAAKDGSQEAKVKQEVNNDVQGLIAEQPGGAGTTPTERSVLSVDGSAGVNARTNPSHEDNLAGDLNQGKAKDRTLQDLTDLGVAGDIFNGGLGSTDFVNISTDADFGSMFNDSSGTSTDPLNFDLDFSSSAAVGDAALMGNGPGAAGPTADLGSLDQTSSEDINSLLPGLESYVNADGDGSNEGFPMINVPNGDANANFLSTSGPQQSSSTAQNPSATGATGDASGANDDPNFDDIFGTTDEIAAGASTDFNFDDFFDDN